MKIKPVYSEPDKIISFDVKYFDPKTEKFLNGNEEYKDQLTAKEHLYTSSPSEFLEEGEELTENLKAIEKECQKQEASYFRFIDRG